MPKFLLSLFIIVSLTAALSVVLVRTGPESQATLQPPPPPHVVTTVVESRHIRPVTRLTGQLRPTRRSQLHFEVSGQLRRRAVEPGQRVEAGDLLLKLEDGDYADSVTEARGALDQERAMLRRDRRLLELMQQQVQLQQNEVDRMDNLGQRSLASKSNFDSAMQTLLQLQAETARLQNSIDSAASRLQQHEAAYNRARRNLERSELRAPFAATVDSVAVDAGDYVTPGQMAVTLVQMEELDLALDVPGHVVAHLDRGQSVEVAARSRGTDISLSGRIIAIAADPDPRTYTHTVRIRIAARGLIPGQLASAALPGQAYPDAHTVPATAILHDDGQTYVFVVADGRVHRQPVTLVRRHGEQQIIEGVAAGTAIVARDVAALADDQRVSSR